MVCSCDSISPETPLNFITQCPLFADKRQTLYDQVEQNYIPQFSKLSLRRQFDILVHGFEPLNSELTQINTKILILTQNFILRTKRFDGV